jgi:hypothetical protein
MPPARGLETALLRWKDSGSIGRPVRRLDHEQGGSDREALPERLIMPLARAWPGGE